MKESCPRVWEGSDYILWYKQLPTPAPLISTLFLNTNPQDPPYGVLVLHLQMLKITAWSFLTCWNLVRRRGRRLPVDGTSAPNLHGNSLIFFLVAVRPAVHTVTEWSGWWPGEGEWDPVSLSLFLSLSLPSADLGSSFDWISCELLRQAWRKASVVEVSYHILICSLSDACALWSCVFL